MTRRAPGEGALFKRADGRWEASFTFGYEGGKRRRRKRVGRTQAEALRKLDEVREHLGQGLSPDTSRMTTGEWLDRWLTDEARPSVRPSTFRSYSMIVERHLTPALGSIPLKKLNPSQIQQYFTSKLADGQSARSVQLHHATLKRALHLAERYGYVARNVARLVTPPRVTRPEIRPLDPQEARAFMSAVRGHRFEALFMAAMATGCRQGELLGLRWSSIDMDASTLRVDVSLQRVDREYVLVPPKTAKSHRTLVLPAPVVTALRRWRVRQKEERLQAGPLWSGNSWDLVFTAEDGSPLGGRRVTREFQAALAEAGLPCQRFHDLRHAAASLMLAEGVSMKVVQEVLGHSTIVVTADTYSHVMPELRRDAAERIGGVLFAGQ